MLETLEDRSVPTGLTWALPADPEGYVFHDVNGNGVFDVEESAVGAGWSVYVDENDNSLLDPGEINTTTDATGHYNIFLPDGTYSIKVVPQGSFQTDARPPGTFVREFASVENGVTEGAPNYSGLAWVNDSLYATFTRSAGGSNVMYQIDPESGAALGPAIPIPAEVHEISFDGTDFWGSDFQNNLIIRFNFAGQELQRLSFAGMNITAVEWDGTALRVADRIAHRIYQIDPSGAGTILGYIDTPNENVGGLAFDGTSLWINGRDSDRIYALDPATGAVQNSFTAPGDFGSGLAVRGTNLWVSDNWLSRIFQYDLGYGGGRIVTIAGADVTGVDLAVFELASVSGTVFNDENQNGVQDPVDSGMAGWRIYLDSNSNGQYEGWETSALSDGNGNYTFSGLRPGNYLMREDLATQLHAMPHWQQTSPAGGAYSPLVVSSGELHNGRDFGNHLNRIDPVATDWGTGAGDRLNLFTGLDWYDLSSKNTNGSQWWWEAANEYANNATFAGFDDWRLPTLNEALAAARDQAANTQGFLTEEFGTTPPPYWTSTLGSKLQGKQQYWRVYFHNPAQEPGQGPNGYLALAIMTRDTGLYVDDGGAGFSQVGSWSTLTLGKKPKALTGYSGDARNAAAGNGSSTATWTFNGLEPGATYKIATTWTAGNYATNAPFTVLDGVTSLGTVVVNQSSAPNDFEIAGTNWEGLGVFTTNSGSLSVKLSNQADGAVIADAVRIFRVYPGFGGSSLMASTVGTAGTAAKSLTNGALRPIIQEAIRRWAATGLTAAERKLLRTVRFQIANLDGATLGVATGNVITLDRTAAGHGWFVDKAPRNDSEFTKVGNQGEQGRIDLLTVVMHELGHVLGRPHGDSDLMTETLSTGTRIGL